MREEFSTKLDNLIKEIDNDGRIKRIEELKKEINNDSRLLEIIKKLGNLDPYSSRYIDLKKELFKDKKFTEFKQLENEINYLILEINNKLNDLTSKKGCK